MSYVTKEGIAEFTQLLRDEAKAIEDSNDVLADRPAVFLIKVTEKDSTANVKQDAFCASLASMEYVVEAMFEGMVKKGRGDDGSTLRWAYNLSRAASLLSRLSSVLKDESEDLRRLVDHGEVEA